VADAADDYDLGPDMIDQGNGALRSYLGDQNRAFSTGMQGYGGALDYLRGHSYPTQSRGYLELAAGLLSPTKSGGWAESFGKGASNLSKVQDTNYKEEFERNMKIADIQKLQSELYKQRGDAQWQGFERSAQVPKLAAEAAAGRQLYHDYRTPGLTAPGRPADETPTAPTSQVPVSPAVPAPTPVPTANPVPDEPPPKPVSALMPPDATTARASLRTPRTDVAGDYAVPQGPMTPMPQPAPRPTEVAELYRVPDGTPRPQEPGSVIKQPERTRGQYPSPTGLERTPGAPNYDFTPPDPRSPGGAIPGGSLPNTRIGAAEQVLDDNGRPINPASLAASGTTATDAPSPADDAARAATREAAVAAGRKATPGTPAPAAQAPIGNSPASSGAGSTMPDASTPPVKIPTSGSREETGLKEAPSAAAIQWAKQIQQTIAGNDARLTVNRAGPRGDDWRTKQKEAEDILKKADAALTVARQQSAAQVEAWKSSPGHERDTDMLKAKNKRDQEILQRAQEAEQDANKRESIVGNYDRAYRQFLSNHRLFGTGPIAGRIAGGFPGEDDNYANLDRAGILMQDLKVAGVGSVSDKEGKKIEATSVGPLVNDKDTEDFLVQQRGEIVKAKEYAKFLRTWAQNNAGDMDGADTAWQQIQTRHPVVSLTKDGRAYKLNEQNAGLWRHYLGVDETGKPIKDDKQHFEKRPDGSVVIDDYKIWEH
jgi:hypothetical protein